MCIQQRLHLPPTVKHDLWYIRVGQQFPKPRSGRTRIDLSLLALLLGLGEGGAVVDMHGGHFKEVALTPRGWGAHLWF